MLDPGGFVLSDTPGEQTYPDVVALRQGQGFLVAWVDERNGNPDIFGTIVRADASLPFPEGFPIATTPDVEITPALAFDGARVLATWSRLAPERHSVRGNFVRPDGTLASPEDFLLSEGRHVRESDPDVVYAPACSSWPTAPRASSTSRPTRSSSAPA